VVRIVTNDVAVKVAATYNSPTSDIIMGYISSGDLGSKSIYSSDELNEVNRARAESYVKYILDLANFSGVVEDVNLKLGMEKDAMNRSHIKVTTECTFNTPFGEGLELVGMSKSSKYSMTAYAEATNISDYVSAVSLADAIGSGQILAGTGFVEKVYKAINSVVKVYNKVVS
jgi:hypothetical protein